MKPANIVAPTPIPTTSVAPPKTDTVDLNTTSAILIVAANPSTLEALLSGGHL